MGQAEAIQSLDICDFIWEFDCPIFSRGVHEMYMRSVDPNFRSQKSRFPGFLPQTMDQSFGGLFVGSLFFGDTEIP